MNRLFDVLSLSLLVGGVFVLTAPKSKGPQLFVAATNGFAHIEQAATGQKLS